MADIREDLVHDDRVGELRDESAWAAAMRAAEDVDGEHSAQELGPDRARRARTDGVAGRGRRVGSERAAGRRSGCGRALGHDEITPSGGRGEHAVVGELMGARGWHECGEPLDEGQRIEGDGRSAVAPVAFEAVGRRRSSGAQAAIRSCCVRSRSPRERTFAQTRTRSRQFMARCVHASRPRRSNALPFRTAQPDGS